MPRPKGSKNKAAPKRKPKPQLKVSAHAVPFSEFVAAIGNEVAKHVARRESLGERNDVPMMAEASQPKDRGISLANPQPNQSLSRNTMETAKSLRDSACALVGRMQEFEARMHGEPMSPSTASATSPCSLNGTLENIGDCLSEAHQIFQRLGAYTGIET